MIEPHSLTVPVTLFSSTLSLTNRCPHNTTVPARMHARPGRLECSLGATQPQSGSDDADYDSGAATNERYIRPYWLVGLHSDITCTASRPTHSLKPPKHRVLDHEGVRLGQLVAGPGGVMCPNVAHIYLHARAREQPSLQAAEKYACGHR